MTRTIQIMARDLTQPIAPMPPPESLDATTLSSTRDEHFGLLDQFCIEHGFPAGWARLRLESSARAWLVIEHAQPVASAWATDRPMFIEEIGHTYTPPQNGDYFFGDFVAPASRGRHLQRWLINLRLQASAAAHQWATAMFDLRNIASANSYAQEQFTPAAAVKSRRLRGWKFDRLRQINGSVPSGTLSGNGWSQRLSMSFGRA